jgi:hypothetical protein
MAGAKTSLDLVAKYGSPDAARKMLADIQQKRKRTTLEYDKLSEWVRALESLQEIASGKSSDGLVPDHEGFRSKFLCRAIRNDSPIFVAIEGGDKRLADRITLAQKFKIVEPIPDMKHLFHFGIELHKSGLLRLPYDPMYIEYVEMYSATRLPTVLFIEKGVVQVIVHHCRHWIVCNPVPLWSDMTDSGEHFVLVSFLVMLASRSTEVLPSHENGNPMTAVEAAGRRCSHHIVRLKAFAPSAHHGGHHAPPRLHWRRGHVRRQRYGIGRRRTKTIWVAPVLVGDAERGVVTHDYQLAAKPA